MKPTVKTPRQMAAILEDNSNLILQLIMEEKDIRKISLYSGIGSTLLDMSNAMRKSYNDKESTV